MSNNKIQITLGRYFGSRCCGFFWKAPFHKFFWRSFRRSRLSMSRRSAYNDHLSGIFNLPPEASTEVGGGVFTGSKIASKTLAIHLFLGVPVVVTDSFGSVVTSIFGFSATFSDSGSLVGSAIASIGIAGAVSMARGSF
jgi:hypothetical protein